MIRDLQPPAAIKPEVRIQYHALMQAPPSAWVAVEAVRAAFIRNPLVRKCTVILASRAVDACLCDHNHAQHESMLLTTLPNHNHDWQSCRTSQSTGFL